MEQQRTVRGIAGSFRTGSIAREGALKTAERAEEAYPRASIDLYQQHVERLITERGRANYQVACSYLIKIRSLYEKLNETGEWTTYIAWLRRRHSRLISLKEEQEDHIAVLPFPGYNSN